MAQQKRLVRKESSKMMAGVCAGLAEYFNVDVTLIRIVFVAATLLDGVGILAYVILWISMPVEKTDVLPAATPPEAPAV